jgi:hypothetical protein
MNFGRPLQQKETKQTKNPRGMSRQKLLLLLVEEFCRAPASGANAHYAVFG